MNARLAVNRVSDQDWEAFHDILLDRRSTLDMIAAWLKRRGYRISRHAIHRYKTNLAKQCFNVPDTRMSRRHLVKRIETQLPGLSQGQLATVAAFVAFTAVTGVHGRLVGASPCRTFGRVTPATTPARRTRRRAA